MKRMRIGGGRRRERVAVNRQEGAQPRQFHKGGKSGRFLKSVNFLRLSLSVSVGSLSPFLDAEDVYGSSWKRLGEGYGSKIVDTEGGVKREIERWA